MGKGTPGKVGLILLTRKPVPTCARGFRVKTLKKPLKPSPWPGLHQQRIHREEGRGEGLRTQWGICNGSVQVSEQGCSTRAKFHFWISMCLQQQLLQGSQSCQSSIPTPRGFGCAVPRCSNKFYSILFYSIPPSPQGRYDPTPQSFKIGFSDYFAPTVISPESPCFSAVAHTLSLTLS